ncbi:MAG: hypothetical protein A2X94_02165 [Bdellovibrionales bacterium GWB1_55_8]|nr:MAG: hypothetical protein A2X94_02165 [Bdellovibrionales bacterium GWB1_55_8]
MSLINPADFSPRKVDISLSNPATRTAIRHGSRLFDGREIAPATIDLLELHETGFVLEIPTKTCASGQIISLEIQVADPNAATIGMKATAKVTLCETASTERDTVTLSFIQYDLQAWSGLREGFTRRQEEIMDFLRTARGL